jgi:hypothetical protein
VYGSSVTIFVGSGTENWSNKISLPIMESRALKSIPYFGSVFGGTVVRYKFDNEVILNKPTCIFGTTMAMYAELTDKYTLDCTSPPADDVGLVRVSIVDSSNAGINHEYGSAMYKYSYPPEITSVLPSNVYENSTSFITVQGANFLDNRLLACVVNSEHIHARWVSNSLIVCEVEGKYIFDELIIQVTNNGKDISRSNVTVPVMSTFHVVHAAPLLGSIFGGTPVSI